MRPTVRALSKIYADNTARSWLALWDCLLSPTGIGDLEIVFPSERLKLEFCLRFPQYVCT